jgi:hypothetical protein
LIDGVKVGGITELSAFADDDEVPASPFSPSGILTVGSSSLAVDFLGFTPLEPELPTFSGERANVWEGEWRCKNQRSNPRWTPKSPEKNYGYEIQSNYFVLPTGRISGRRREKIANMSTEASHQQIIFDAILLNLPVH